MSIRDVLPIHPVPPGVEAGARDGVLVTGLVERQGRVALREYRGAATRRLHG